MNHIVLDDWDGCDRPAPHDVGGGEQPAGVANGRHDIAARVQLADEVDDCRRTSQVLGREPAGHDHRIDIVGGQVIDAGLGHYRIAEFARVHLACGGTDDRYLHPGLAQS